MKIDFLADTNFLIYLHEGHPIAEPFIGYNIGISFISEIEVLGFKGITETQEVALRILIEDCFQLSWDNRVRERTISIRRTSNLKLPDAIIAATSLVCELPLVTADRGFSKIDHLDLILIEP